jgi:hypothetical protein
MSKESPRTKVKQNNLTFPACLVDLKFEGQSNVQPIDIEITNTEKEAIDQCFPPVLHLHLERAHSNVCYL